MFYFSLISDLLSKNHAKVQFFFELSNLLCIFFAFFCCFYEIRNIIIRNIEINVVLEVRFYADLSMRTGFEDTAKVVVMAVRYVGAIQTHAYVRDFHIYTTVQKEYR